MVCCQKAEGEIWRCPEGTIGFMQQRVRWGMFPAPPQRPNPQASEEESQETLYIISFLSLGLGLGNLSSDLTMLSQSILGLPLGHMGVQQC